MTSKIGQTVTITETGKTGIITFDRGTAIMVKIDGKDESYPVEMTNLYFDKAPYQAQFAQASYTGKPVAIDHYVVECHRSDCSLDNVTEYAMPDGTLKVIRSHTF